MGKVILGMTMSLDGFINTDGVQSAIEQAKLAAGERDITVVGGANLFQQILRARLFDELQIGIIPILLGEGLRLFEPAGGTPIQLEKHEVIESPDRTDLIFRLIQ